jgi:hypothetical protein
MKRLKFSAWKNRNRLIIRAVLSVFIIIISFNGFGQSDTASLPDSNQYIKSFIHNQKKWNIEIPVWIPGFRGEFAYGDISLDGGDGDDPGEPEDPDDDNNGDIISRIFSKEWYLKFFFIGAVKFEHKGLFLKLDNYSGNVGQNIKFNYNNKNIVSSQFRSINSRLTLGYRIINYTSANKKFRYTLHGLTGMRWHYLEAKSALTGTDVKLDLNHGWVEPLLGIKNTFTFNRWEFIAQGDIGGFYFNRRASSQLNFSANYRSGKSTSIKFGWNILNLNYNRTVLNEPLKININLQGPAAGIVFYLGKARESNF